MAILSQQLNPDIGFSNPELAQDAQLLNPGLGAGPLERFEEWRNYWRLPQEQRPGARPTPGASSGPFVDTLAGLQGVAESGGGFGAAAGVAGMAGAGPPAPPGADNPLEGVHPALVQTPGGSIGIPFGPAGASPQFGQAPDQIVEADPNDGDFSLTADQNRLRDYARRILGVEWPTPAQMQEIWEDAITQMELAEDLGMDPRDPWHWLEEASRTAAGEEEAAQAAEQATSESIQSVVNLTDPDTARMVIKTAMQRLLRRTPNDEEVDQFIARLNEQELANPTVTTTTATPAPLGSDGLPTGPSETETQTEGGTASPGDLAEGFIDDEFADEQAIIRTGEYFNALQSAIGSIA